MKSYIFHKLSRKKNVYTFSFLIILTNYPIESSRNSTDEQSLPWIPSKFNPVIRLKNQIFFSFSFSFSSFFRKIIKKIRQRCLYKFQRVPLENNQIFIGKDLQSFSGKFSSKSLGNCISLNSKDFLQNFFHEFLRKIYRDIYICFEEFLKKFLKKNWFSQKFVRWLSLKILHGFLRRLIWQFFQSIRNSDFFNQWFFFGKISLQVCWEIKQLVMNSEFIQIFLPNSFQNRFKRCLWRIIQRSIIKFFLCLIQIAAWIHMLFFLNFLKFL